MRQDLSPGRMTLVSLACAAMLAACGGGGGDGGGEGRLQVISFNYPGGGTLLTPPRTLVATTTSGLPVTFASGTPSTCTVAGDQMTLVAAGECLITANQGGGTSADGVKWARAEPVSQLFNVLKHEQTVTIEAPDYVLSANTSQVTLAAAASSGLPVTLSASPATVCSISGNTLMLLGKGSCQVTATQPGDENYEGTTANSFVAVDPLIVADGILGAGRGGTRSAMTLQNGAVTANPWSSLLNSGWEFCDPNDGCFTSVSADESTFTSALHINTPSQYQPGWWNYSFNNVEIFAPGLSGFNQSGDTTGGLQVTTETLFAMTLGVNQGLYNAKKPVVVHLDLGRRNGDCNVTASTLLWPPAPLAGVGIPLEFFAVTESCGLAGVTSASLDNDIRTLPNPWGTGPADAPAAAAAYLAALENIRPARDSAVALLQSSNIVRVRLRLMDINLTHPDVQGGSVLASDLSIVGAIKIQ